MGLICLLLLLGARDIERRLEGFDPNTLRRGTRIFYGRAKGQVLMIPFLRIAGRLLMAVGAALMLVGGIGLLIT